MVNSKHIPVLVKLPIEQKAVSKTCFKASDHKVLNLFSSIDYKDAIKKSVMISEKKYFFIDTEKKTISHLV